MKISVVMIDGSFRDHTYSAKYFCEQDFPKEEYEVIWVEYYANAAEGLHDIDGLTIVTLDNPEDKEYHSSYCFNEGIRRGQGELIVIPDADQIVEPDFLSRLWELHQKDDELVIYPYRYDEIEAGILESLEFDELKAKCKLKNPENYGGCLSVRKKWLMKINGYEQHEIMSSGFHANGKDMYMRFRNLGLAIKWEPSLKMYHPWHPFSRVQADVYKYQKKLINWRFMNLQYMAIEGIVSTADLTETPADLQAILDKDRSDVVDETKVQRSGGVFKKLLGK